MMICAFFKQILFLAFFVNVVCGACRFDLLGEAIIGKRFGFNRVFLTKQDQTIYIKPHETISAFCETGFSISGNYRGDNIELKCNSSDSLYFRESGRQEWSALYNNVYCNRASGTALYESALKLTECEQHTSLAIGTSALNSTIYAGICYDWNMRNLKYVNYLAYKNKNAIYPLATTENELNINSVSLDEKILSYSTDMTFMSQNQFAAAYGMLQEKDKLLKNLEFDHANLMQDMPLKDVFEEYNDILSIIWWRNLRLLNWRTFLDLLEERSKTVKYNIKIGVSGEIYIPTNDCTNKTLTIFAENNLRKAAPVNIWAHLNAVSGNSADDFVVIGYNSPFFTAYDSANIMCEDICETIDWMRTFGRQRLMPTMGLIICCRPADVARKLENFPWPVEVAAAEIKEEEANSKTIITSSLNTEAIDFDFLEYWMNPNNFN